jgi:TolB protein
MLAYRRWQVEDRGIVVANSDGSNPLRVTDKLEDVLPSFSPDRAKVAFSSYRWGDRKSRLYYAWTDDESRTTWEWGDGGIYGEDPYWMADGRILYRVSRRDQPVEELWAMNGADGQDRQLLYSANSIRSPAARQEGRLVTFMAQDAGNWDIYTLDLSTSAVRRLTTDSAHDGLPTWSPDGRHIAFVSDRSGSWALWVMRADGGGQRVLAPLPGPVDG